MVNRREFLDALAVGAAGLAIRANAKSYGQILGSNNRLNFAVIGLNSRAYAHLSALKANKDTACITHVADVDSNTLEKFATKTLQAMGSAPTAEKDFRKVLVERHVVSFGGVERRAKQDERLCRYIRQKGKRHITAHAVAHDNIRKHRRGLQRPPTRFATRRCRRAK